MANIKKLAKVRPTICRVSSSISNWKDKIFKRYNGVEYSFWQHHHEPVTFFGLYRPTDILMFLLHSGPRTVVWCGSDILQLGLLAKIVRYIDARHICENQIEEYILQVLLQQHIEVKPLFFSNPQDFEVCYQSSKTPSVWIHINKAAHKESGFLIIQRIARKVPEVTFHIYGRAEKVPSPANIIFHGYVDEKTFNQEIKNYQASLRLHEFDGFAETIGKSVLMGQYPISRIRYPHMDTFNDDQDLIRLLKALAGKKSPNTKARNYYLRQFSKSL